MSRPPLILLALALWLGLSCGGPRPPGDPPSAAVSLSPPATRAAAPATPRASPTAAALAARPCTTPEQPPAGPLATPEPEDLLAYVNRGASPGQLQAALEAQGLLAGPGVVEADLDGDGLQDLAFSVLAAHSPAFPPPGRLVVLRCLGEAYELAFSSPLQADRGAPVVHAARDLTGDGAVDLLVGQASCGAHTCVERAQVLVWGAAGLENRLVGETQHLPNPEYRLPSPGGGAQEIHVWSTGIGSVGAGPQRAVNAVWRWDPEEGLFQPVGETPEPARFRVHVLHDADGAAARGRLGEALVLYRQVIEDPALEEWLDPRAERAVLSAYARFRVLVSLLQSGEALQAEEAYRELLGSHPQGDPGHGLTLLAQSFWQAYLSAGRPEEGCRAARRWAAEHPEETTEVLYFGYANPAYEAHDLCPLGLP